MRNKIQKTLLSKGYFPKELPSVFTTDDFGRLSAEILEDWEKAKLFKIDAKGLGKTPAGRKRVGG
jgi:hypothetical protein